MLEKVEHERKKTSVYISIYTEYLRIIFVVKSNVVRITESFY